MSGRPAATRASSGYSVLRIRLRRVVPLPSRQSCSRRSRIGRRNKVALRRGPLYPHSKLYWQFIAVLQQSSLVSVSSSSAKHE